MSLCAAFRPRLSTGPITNFSVKDLVRSLIYHEPQEDTNMWYEAQLRLPVETSSVVRAFKILYFPSNKKGEVTDEDFKLLMAQGHIGKGRLQLAEDFLSGRSGLNQMRHSSEPIRTG